MNTNTNTTATLRDQFAMAALTGMLAWSGSDGTYYDQYAMRAYALADDMMQEREKAQGHGKAIEGGTSVEKRERSQV